MKKLLTSILIVLALFALPIMAFADNSDEGSAGEGVYWVLDKQGTLTIFGEGEVTSAPW